ncbi:hypothetical protein GGR57DRAFT_507449 [Xylariaceae sp. FL1272]|nr:hypothetical protein GGR57DRAFT_507449 [Xylariaceae sp. FL1272]
MASSPAAETTEQGTTMMIRRDSDVVEGSPPTATTAHTKQSTEDGDPMAVIIIKLERALEAYENSANNTPTKTTISEVSYDNSTALVLSTHPRPLSSPPQITIDASQFLSPLGDWHKMSSLARSPVSDNVWAIKISPRKILTRLWSLVFDQVDACYKSDLHAPQTASDFLQILGVSRFSEYEAFRLIAQCWGVRRRRRMSSRVERKRDDLWKYREWLNTTSPRRQQRIKNHASRVEKKVDKRVKRHPRTLPQPWW